MTPPGEQELRTEDLAPALGIPDVAEQVLDRLAVAGHARIGFCEACWASAGGEARAYIEIVAAVNTVAAQEEPAS